MTASPLFRHAFKQLLNDEVVKGHLERLLLEGKKSEIKGEISSIESELQVHPPLSRLSCLTAKSLYQSSQGYGTKQRISYLDRKLVQWQNELNALD